MASFVPTIVITDDSTSVKLFTASKIIAIEFTITPMVALNITRIIFTNIPKMLVFTITLFLSILFSPFYRWIFYFNFLYMIYFIICGLNFIHIVTNSYFLYSLLQIPHPKYP